MDSAPKSPKPDDVLRRMLATKPQPKASAPNEKAPKKARQNGG